jgi:hypothetical protein
MMPYRPLGIADVVSMAEAGVNPAHESHWYWCRRHRQPVMAGEPCTDLEWPEAPSGYLHARMKDCIRIGPFMSEREALRLTTLGAPYGKTVKHLGMEIER